MLNSRDSARHHQRLSNTERGMIELYSGWRDISAYVECRGLFLMMNAERLADRQLLPTPIITSTVLSYPLQRIEGSEKCVFDDAGTLNVHFETEKGMLPLKFAITLRSFTKRH